MACCGGRRGGRRLVPKAAQVAGTERVLMEYTGPRAELFSTRGPATGVRYYASSQEHERALAVWVEDVEGLAASGAWRPVRLTPEIETVGVESGEVGGQLGGDPPPEGEA